MKKLSIAMPSVIIAMGAFAIYCLWNSQNTVIGMYGNTDGGWAAWNLAGLYIWSTAFDFSPFNPLAGMGTLFLPNLPWLNPGAWPFATGWPIDAKYAASYLIYGAQLLASSYLLFRTIGGSRLQGFVAVQMLFFLLPPFNVAAHVLAWLSAAPVNAHIIALCNLSLAALLRIGDGPWRQSLAWAGGLIVFSAAAYASAPMTIVTYVPVYGAFAVLFIVDQRPSGSAIAARMAASAIASVALYASGALTYLTTTAAMSARSSAVSGMVKQGSIPGDIGGWIHRACGAQFSQLLLCPTSSFSIIQFLAIAGAATVVLLVPRRRISAIGYIGFVVSLHLYWMAWTYRGLGPFNAINPAFLAWSAYPFLAYFAAGLVIPLDNRRWGWVVASIIPVLMLIFWFGSYARTQEPPAQHKQAIGPLPPAATMEARRPALVQRLMRDIALAPGSRFRGRAAVYFSQDDGWLSPALGKPAAGVPLYIQSRAYLQRAFGTTFQETDLWSAGIPTFGEYGQWVGAIDNQFATKFLSAHRYRMSSSFLRVYDLNLPVLRLVGVRYLITDTELHDLRLIAEEKAPETAGPIRLYEIDDVNTGNYSPVDIAVSIDFRATIKQLSGHLDELNHFGVATKEPGGRLVPASQSILSFVRDGWRLQAKSTGRSIIAVPVRYSRCWTLDLAPPDVRLYRGNAIQTFVEFEGDIDITATLEFGLFGAMDCRREDVADIEQMAVK